MWVGLAPGAAPESETVSGRQVRLRQAGALLPQCKWPEGQGCREMPNHVRHLDGKHPAMFLSQGENNTVGLDERTEKRSPWLYASISTQYTADTHHMNSGMVTLLGGETSDTEPCWAIQREKGQETGFHRRPWP